MVRTTDRKAEGNRAAIYARVSDKSQAGEDKTSISEQSSQSLEAGGCPSRFRILSTKRAVQQLNVAVTAARWPSGSC